VSRTPDKPGTYRIRPTQDGGFRLSGVKADGTRVKERFRHEFEAQGKAESIFGKKEYDDWGLPVSSMRASAETVAGLNASLGIAPPGVSTAPPKVDPAKAAANSKFAQSLMEMVGMAWATGDVILARRLTENIGKDPVKPNPKQVNDLAESAKETLIGWFGDRNIKPWQMTILLSIGIPLAMMLQSPPKKVEASKQAQPDLKSVP
jgi:hypothetical protein